MAFTRKPAHAQLASLPGELAPGRFLCALPRKSGLSVSCERKAVLAGAAAGSWDLHSHLLSILHLSEFSYGF